MCFVTGFVQIFMQFLPRAKYDWPEGANNVKTVREITIRQVTFGTDVIGVGAGLYGSVFGILILGFKILYTYASL